MIYKVLSNNDPPQRGEGWWGKHTARLLQSRVYIAVKWCCFLCALGCPLNTGRGREDKEGELCGQCDLSAIPDLALDEKRRNALLEDVTAHCLWDEVARAVCVNVFHVSSIQWRWCWWGTESTELWEWFLCFARGPWHGFICPTALTISLGVVHAFN